jgi:hypothetical protein
LNSSSIKALPDAAIISAGLIVTVLFGFGVARTGSSTFDSVVFCDFFASASLRLCSFSTFHAPWGIHQTGVFNTLSYRLK